MTDINSANKQQFTPEQKAIRKYVLFDKKIAVRKPYSYKIEYIPKERYKHVLKIKAERLLYRTKTNN